MEVRIVICQEDHLLRLRWDHARPGDDGRAYCPQCGRVVGVKVIDSRMLSQEGLTEAWRYRGR